MNNTETTMTDSVMTDAEMADFFARSLTNQVYACEVKPARKLGDVTWVMGQEPPARLAHDLLWADKRKGR